MENNGAVNDPGTPTIKIEAIKELKFSVQNKLVEGNLKHQVTLTFSVDIKPQEIARLDLFARGSYPVNCIFESPQQPLDLTFTPIDTRTKQISFDDLPDFLKG